MANPTTAKEKENKVNAFYSTSSLSFHWETRNAQWRICLLFFFSSYFMVNNGYCKESNHMSCGQLNMSYAGLLSSVLVHRPSVFAPSVAAELLLSILQLFYEQLPFFSSTSLPCLISSFVFSPKQSFKTLLR